MKKIKFYIVPTPIGNLKDITIRAINSLKKSDLIIVENIYKSLILLNKYNLKKKLINYNKNNEYKRIKKIFFYIKKKKYSTFSLISDAGTPSISDPGFKLINKLIKYNKYIKIIPLPGPTALIPSLIISGFPINNFIFLGFLTKKNIKKNLTKIKNLNYTIVFYDSPKRILNTLSIIYNILGNIKIVICKELTKKFEQIIRNNVLNLINKFKKKKIKGELTYVIK